MWNRQRVLACQILMGVMLAAGYASVPGDRWTGTSTGEGCHPLKLVLGILDGEISGSAQMQTASGTTLHWEAKGRVLPGGAVVLSTTTGDLGNPRNSIRWEGTLTESTLMLRQPSSLGCREPRSVVMTRSR